MVQKLPVSLTVAVQPLSTKLITLIRNVWACGRVPYHPGNQSPLPIAPCIWKESRGNPVSKYKRLSSTSLFL